MTTRLLCLEDLCSAEPDYDLVLVYSDYCEDAGDLERAKALRWLVANEKWPAFGYHHFGQHCCWWNVGRWSDQLFHAYENWPRYRLPLPFLQAAHANLFVNMYADWAQVSAYRETAEESFLFVIEAFFTLYKEAQASL